MLPSQTILTLLPIVVLLICLSIPFIRQLDAQVIRLRRPAQSSTLAYLHPNQAESVASSSEPVASASSRPPAPAARVPINELPPPNIRNRRPPQAGNLIVRFGPDHEIQRLEYVMRDGRLATVYSRPREPQVQARQHSSARSPDGASSSSPIEVPGQSGPDKVGLATPQPVEGKQQQEEPEPEPVVVDLNGSEFGDAESIGGQGGEFGDKSDILGAVASELANSGHKTSATKLTKAKGILAKIKAKFAQLPQLIEKNLQAKSSHGKAFIDHKSGPQERPGPQLVYARIPYPGHEDKQQHQQHQHQQEQQQQHQQQQQQQKQVIPLLPPAAPSINEQLDQLDVSLRQQVNKAPVVQQESLSEQKLLNE